MILSDVCQCLLSEERAERAAHSLPLVAFEQRQSQRLTSGQLAGSCDLVVLQALLDEYMTDVVGMAQQGDRHPGHRQIHDVAIARRQPGQVTKDVRGCTGENPGSTQVRRTRQS